MLFAKNKPSTFWEGVRSEEQYKPFRDELDWLYERYCNDDIKALPFSDYMITYRTGSRREYESQYFSHRARLNTCALMFMIYGDKYLDELENIIWAICDEYCWALPAHVRQHESVDTAFIDLFAAETGFALSEIYHIVGDKLTPLVAERIKTCVKERIIDSFLSREFYFETMDNNWSAVCAGSVGIAFIYMAPNLFPVIQVRLEKAMEHFFSSFKADGVCREGIGYWNYGFGFYTCFAQLVREFTGGECDYFKQDRVRTIAAFGQQFFLQDNVSISFSDGSRRANHPVGLTHFLHKQYPDDIAALPFKYRVNYMVGTGDNAFRWCHLIRSIVWYDDTLADTALSPDAYHYMPDSAWYIKRNAHYAFAAKAGDNQEPHNHNDIGHFILAVGGDQIFCDLGAGEYVMQYFAQDTRYDFLCNSSRSHSVPLIDGIMQHEGTSFTGQITNADSDRLDMDIHNAYDIPALGRISRSFELGDKSIILSDRFEFKDGFLPIKERLVTQVKPIVQDGKITVGPTCVHYDSAVWNVSVLEEEFINHSAKPEPVYCIDFVANTNMPDFEVTIEIL